MTQPRISARTITLLADAANLRRLRVAYRADPELYAELVTVTAIALAYQAGTANGTELGISRHRAEESALTVRQAAARIGISPRGVRKALEAKRLRGTFHHGRWLIAPEDAHRYATRAA